MRFIGFEYKSRTECTLVLRETTDDGSIDVGSITIPIDHLRMAVDSGQSFLTLLVPSPLENENQVLLKTLTECQAEGTRLVLENRRLKQELQIRGTLSVFVVDGGAK